MNQRLEIIVVRAADIRGHDHPGLGIVGGRREDRRSHGREKHREYRTGSQESGGSLWGERRRVGIMNEVLRSPVMR
ncbi:hypothetical protein [uncultured Paludibaculum sp.]|uniref:hypothetical protein n=1 Tax=uncultured Paludibaculum sp. TaxID=1765020 RepID=UPI002AAABC75|nr:hypothetical protein [uncultured Paludibaculum sp.]